MRRLFPLSIRMLLVAGLCLLLTQSLMAQSPRSSFRQVPKSDDRPASNTILEMELLTGTEGNGLAGQQWRTILEPLGIQLRVRRALFEEKPEIKEQSLGTLRRVTLIGRLERDGRINFPGHAFTPQDRGRLVEWLDELKTYGAQGSPDGQPMWGLTKPQFGAIYEALTPNLRHDIAGLSLPEAIAKLELPQTYPPRFNTEATERLRTLTGRTARQELHGLSKGTALAILLNDSGLGFHPNRTPDGRIELLVEPLAKDAKPWPIGWPLKDPQQKLAPKLFTLVTIELHEVEFQDVLDAVAGETDVPILIDRHELAKTRLDLSREKVSHPRRQTSWSIALRSMSNQLKLSRELWTDEAGHPFLWITTLRPERLQSQP